MFPTFASDKPMVPVPQQTSRTLVSVLSSANSATLLYNTSAAKVLICEIQEGSRY